MSPPPAIYTLSCSILAPCMVIQPKYYSGPDNREIDHGAMFLLPYFMEMKILLVEPYFTGSHAAWAKGYARFSQHQVEILSLPGQFWKWRMHGGAVSLAKQFLTRDIKPDLILATDMLDLTTFMALTRDLTASIPTAVYFHENQISYPWSPDDRDVQKERDKHYGFINYTSALAADVVFFNSAYHQDIFLEELPRLLKHFPDHQELDTVKKIRSKSRILHLGMELDKFNAYAPGGNGGGQSAKEELPLILWNHRWEYDKNPGEFFEALYVLMKKDLDFNVAVLGENFSQSPQVFDLAHKKLGERVIQFGYAEKFSEYAEWLYKADILPVTSEHDFFGMSVVEAVYCGCFPLLPQRLSYPEILPIKDLPYNYYEDFDDMVRKLAKAVEDVAYIRNLNFRDLTERFSWENMAPRYDEMLLTLCQY